MLYETHHSLLVKVSDHLEHVQLRRVHPAGPARHVGQARPQSEDLLLTAQADPLPLRRRLQRNRHPDEYGGSMGLSES